MLRINPCLSCIANFLKATLSLSRIPLGILSGGESLLRSPELWWEIFRSSCRSRHLRKCHDCGRCSFRWRYLCVCRPLRPGFSSVSRSIAFVHPSKKPKAYAPPAGARPPVHHPLRVTHEKLLPLSKGWRRHRPVIGETSPFLRLPVEPEGRT